MKGLGQGRMYPFAFHRASERSGALLTSCWTTQAAGGVVSVVPR